MSDSRQPNHPELKRGEIFLCNCQGGIPEEFEEISYQTKRAGITAYDDNNDETELFLSFPVFVSEAEYNVRNKEVEVGQ